MFEDQDAVAWTAMPYRARVVTAEGDEIGTAESLLGDEEEDIFHGIAVKTKGGRLAEIPAQRIKRITQQGVATDLNASEVPELPAYREEKWYGIEWGGLFRKHPEWRERHGS